MATDLVAVTVVDGAELTSKLEPRFGRAPRFLVLDPESRAVVEVIINRAATKAHGAGIEAAQLVARSGVKRVVSGRFGPKATQALAGLGISRWCATAGLSVAEVLDRLAADELEQA